MNGQMGSSLIAQYNPGWLGYLKGADLTCPGPANTFVFCDEHPGSINDGSLQIDSSSSIFPDLPASYHGNACGFSFADGHAEERRWRTAALAIPVSMGASFSSITVSANNADWLWFIQHATCIQH